jgi:hypothetical protein
MDVTLQEQTMEPSLVSPSGRHTPADPAAIASLSVENLSP